MTKKDNQSREELARKKLAEPGPSQKTLMEAESGDPDGHFWGNTASGTRALGEGLLGLTRDLEDVHGFPVDIRNVVGSDSPTPENLGLGPEARQVRAEDRGDAVILHPDDILLYKF